MTNVSLIIKAVDQASKVVDRIQGSVGKFTKGVERHEKALRGMGLAGTAVVGVLGLMTKGAENQRKSQQQLAAVVENAGKSWGTYGTAIEAVIAEQQRQTAVSDEEQRAALSRLIPVLGSVDKAMAALPAVLDASAVSGSSAATVAGTLGRALSGAANTAESVGITFDKTATFSERLAATMDKVGGAAAAAATPSEKMRASLGDLSDAVGTALLPIMDRLAGIVSDLANKFTSLDSGTQETIVKLVGAGGLLLSLGLVVSFIPKVIAGIQAISNVLRISLVKSGIGIAVVALGTLAASLGWFTSDEEQLVEDNIAKIAAAEIDLGLSAETAADGIDEVPPALDRVSAALDAFEKTSRTVTELFEKKFGELPASVAKALQDMGAVIETETGFLEDSFAEQMGQILATARTALGDDMPAEFERSFMALDAAWKAGPLKAVADGVDAIDTKLDETPRDVEDMTRQTAVVLATQWEPVAQEIATPVEFSAERAIAAIESIPAAASQAVVAAQAVIDKGTSSFGRTGKGFSVTTELGGSEQVAAAIATTKQTIQNLLNHPAGIGDPVVKFNLNQAQSKLKELNALLASLKAQGLQRGGIVSSGLQVVGERGPEFAQLPRGTRVSSAFDSRQSGPRGGGFVNYGTIQVMPGAETDRMLMDLLAEQT